MNKITAKFQFLLGTPLSVYCRVTQCTTNVLTNLHIVYTNIYLARLLSTNRMAKKRNTQCGEKKLAHFILVHSITQ